MQRAQSVRASVLLALSLAAAACGGGGGGSPPPPPPAPPPPVVVAAASASATSVQEGQPFSVDASASNTNTGSALTYSWAQIAGPSVTIANANLAKLDLAAPEVTADAQAQFRVTVNAGSLVSQATVNVTFANIAQTPAYNGGARVVATATFNIPPRRIFGDATWGMVGVSANATDTHTFLDFTVSPTSDLVVTPSLLANQPAATIIRRVAPLIGAGTDTHFAIIDEAANNFRIMTRTNAGGILARAGSNFTITSPCGFSHGLIGGGRALYVGQRVGFSVYNFTTPTPTLAGSVVTNKPMCAVVAPRYTLAGAEFPDTVLPPAGPFAPTFFDAIALDSSTNTLQVFRNLGPPGPLASYQQISSTPVQLNATKQLQLVGLSELAISGGIGLDTGMALLFTDGTHAGEHRLVVVGFDANHALVQQTYSLGLGVPIQVFTDNIDADTFAPELVVLKSTSPQVEIYEPTLTGGGVASLSGPTFLEVGLGATQAARTLLATLQGMSIVFPEKREIRVIGAQP